MKGIWLSVFLIGFALNSFSQPDFNHWSRFALFHKIAGKWEAQHELQFRYGFSQQRYQTVLFSERTWFTWKQNSLHQLHISPIAFFSHPFSDSLAHRNNEWRISVWDELNPKWGQWSWLNRFGAEVRFLEGNWFRFRYRTGVKWQNEKWGEWSITDELLLGTGNKSVSFQNRLFLQWDHRIFSKHKVQLGFQCVHERQRCQRAVVFSGLVFRL